jgi:hypothetical protein
MAIIASCAAPREPTRPRFPPPPDASDTHAHVFGPAARFPYAADRSYTPPDAPLAKYIAMLDTVGFTRGVLVQGSAHGRDNGAMLDALARHPGRLRGVAAADATVTPAELRRWHEIGVRGLRFNHFFRGGSLHYRGGVPLDAAKSLAPRALPTLRRSVTFPSSWQIPRNSWPPHRTCLSARFRRCRARLRPDVPHGRCAGPAPQQRRGRRCEPPPSCIGWA